MRYIVYALLGVLLVLHQSGLFDDDGRLLFGFLPAPLAFHVGISLAAGAVWWLATMYAWPVDEDAAGAAGGEAR